MEYQYFEICIGDGPKEGVNDIWMCIRGVRAPSIQEAEQFLSADITKVGGHVLNVSPIDRRTAERSSGRCSEFDAPVY